MLRIPLPDRTIDGRVEMYASFSWRMFLWSLVVYPFFFTIGLPLLALGKYWEGERTAFILAVIVWVVYFFLLETSRIRIPYAALVVERGTRCWPVVRVYWIIFHILAVVSLAFYLYQT